MNKNEFEFLKNQQRSIKQRFHLLRDIINKWSVKLKEIDLNQPTIIFAPHQDDETLGCGGTILRKRALGAPVKVIYTTDGSGSNKIMPKEELAAVRAKEALAACNLLHIDSGDVSFLGFENGKLNQFIDEAVEMAVDALERERPSQVFVTYFRDEHDDHRATNEIVVKALRKVNRDITLYEYPVWVWYRWPWIKLPPGRHKKLKTVRTNINPNLHLLAELKYAVDVSDLLQVKYAALAEHKSQMTQLIPHPYWKTLFDASDGEFLGCFFYPYEIFYRHRL